MTGLPQFAGRDYSLTDESARHAIAAGLAAAELYHSDIPRKDMKALMALWNLRHLATATGGTEAAGCDTAVLLATGAAAFSFDFSAD